jgi:hypothetical protein
MGDGWWGFVADDLASGVLVKVLDLALPGYGFYPVYASDHPDALSWNYSSNGFPWWHSILSGQFAATKPRSH